LALIFHRNNTRPTSRKIGANGRVFFCLLGRALKAFKKPAISVADQLALLKKRGLVVADEEFATRRLRHIGYYRLSAYMLPFQNGGGGSDHHAFRSGTTFDDVVKLYVFDRKLRLLFWDGIERIEISVRAGLSGKIAVDHGSHWYENPRLFDARFNHTAYLAEIDRYLDKSKDVFIEHYRRKYTSPTRPPCWMLFECMPFGVISMTVRGLIPRNAGELVGDYQVTHEVLVSWLHAISYTRNLCAHHARLWNRVFTIKPKQARLYRQEMTPNDRLYAQAIVVHLMQRAVAPDTHWAANLAKLLDEHPYVPLDRMGFPKEWAAWPVWKPPLG